MNATLDGIKLTPEEHQILRALVNTVPLGKNIVGLEAAMNNIIQTETYQRLPDTEKAKLLSSIVYEAQEAARDIMRRMLIENGRYYQGLQENYQKRYQAKPKIPSPWVK
jgi:membrane carboxypeptidase/penicillin-binding protein PbpC